MDYKNLIDDVVNELYKRLEIENTQISNKKRAVIIGELDNKDLKAFENIYDLVPFYKFYKFYENIEKYDCIIICNMTVGMLANLAVGCNGCNEEIFILRALLDEKHVYVIESGLEYRKYKKTAYKTLYSLYSDYEKKILQYGINLIGHISDISSETQEYKNCIENFEIVSEEADFTYKNLLLEEDLIKLHKDKLFSVKLNNKCIVTPSAVDFIKLHNVIIKRI